MKCKPIAYNDKEYLLISHSQDKIECNKLSELRYIHKIYGENSTTKPMDYGLYAHKIMENTMDVPIKKRMEMIGQLIMQSGNVYDGLRKKLMKSMLNMNRLANKYDHSEFDFNTNEMQLGFLAPDDWFPKGYKDILNTITEEFDRPKLKGIGFRGKIDYYGRDLETNKLCIVDWKTGSYVKKWAEGYLSQVKEYKYMSYVNNIKADYNIIEYIEVTKKSPNGTTIIVPGTIVEGENIIKGILNRSLDKMKKYINKETFTKTPTDFNCNGCGFNALCRPSKINDMFYTGFKRI